MAGAGAGPVEEGGDGGREVVGVEVAGAGEPAARHGLPVEQPEEVNLNIWAPYRGHKAQKAVGRLERGVRLS